MSKFVTKLVDAVKGIQEFRQLIILADNIEIKKVKIEELDGQLDIYENSLEVKYASSFRRIISIMNAIANCGSLPQGQWKEVTPAGELVKEYEIKAGDLRVFAIKIRNGKLVLLGGYKNQQRQDFKKFRSLKKQYLESI